MKRAYSVYPKNKIITSNSLFQFPLKNSSFSCEKNNLDNADRQSAIPKSEKIKKFIEEINLANSNPNSNMLNFPNEQNSLYTCQKLLIEEKIKNKNYNDNIIALSKQIEELECQIKFGDQSINDEIIKLRQENQELKKFKEKVYSFSLKYDELNRDIINCLKSIEQMIHIFNDDSNSIQNQNIEFRNNNLNKISNNFKSVINDLSDFMKIKQSEYNTLLMEKEKEIQKLKRDFNNLNPDAYSIGLKSCRNFEVNKKQSELSKLNKLNLNNLNDFEKTYQSNNGFYKIYKTNEFDYRKNGKNKNKIKFKSSFNL